jgi:hypothetical protein
MNSSVVLVVPAGSEGSTAAECDAGDIASGGGYTTDGPATLDVFEAKPVESTRRPSVPVTYMVKAANNTSEDHSLQVWVVCLDLAAS